jgi:hypothetical protein
MALPDMMGEGEDSGAEPLDEFETEIRAAFPAEDWTPERVMALKEAIKICVAADQADEYGEDKPPPKKGGEALALIFGGPKKKGG